MSLIAGVINSNVHGGGLLNQEFIALVVDNNDPDKLNRIKVRIRELHRGIEDTDLPWVKADMGGHGNMPGIGFRMIPPTGAKLKVCCTDNDGYSLRVIGPAFQEDDRTEELDSDNVDDYGWVDVGGNKWWISPTNGTIEVTHKTGAYIKIEENGAIKIIAANDLTLGAHGTLNLVGESVKVTATSGNVAINASGNTNIDADGIVNLGNGAPTASLPSVTAREVPEKRDFTGQTDY